MKLFVGNLSWDATEEELKNLFTPVGEVISVRIVQDQYTGRSKGFGFVEMKDQTQAQTAIDTLNDTQFFGRPLRISAARQPEGREGGGSGPRRSNYRGGNGGGQGGGRYEGGRRPFNNSRRPYRPNQRQEQTPEGQPAQQANFYEAEEEG
jgi:RNA recognition motif-containing protein